MNWLERAIAHRMVVHGPHAAWEIAAAAVIAPCLASLTFGPPSATAFGSMAVALAFALLLLAGLRGALLFGKSGFASSESAALRQGGATLGSARPSAPPRSPSTGLPLRDNVSSAIETHDLSAGPALLGLVRFANHGAMVAYDASAARGVMLEFGRRFDAAASRRPVAQISDNSFAILFAGDNAPDSAKAELKSIAYVLSQEVSGPNITVTPDIQVGAAWLNSPLDTFASLLGASEASLTPLKRYGQAMPQTGRSPSQDLADRFAIEQALRRAVRDNQLFLHYQPLVDTQLGRVAGAEALLRWRHPVLGDISPARFVPILEETGLIHEIGLWTLNSACRQLTGWRRSGHDLRLAINLSAIQLQDRVIGQSILRTVAAHGLTPADIELELTETAAMEDQHRTIELFEELRGQGFGIAIDDFGSGHSNLSYLKNLPFTKLKIDREFVSHADTHPGSRAICKALVELADGLGIGVLAEGVERFEEVTALRRMGCRHFQGFYFSRPLSADAFAAQLTDLSWISLLGSDVHRSHAELQKRVAQ